MTDRIADYFAGVEESGARRLGEAGIAEWPRVEDATGRKRGGPWRVNG